MAGRIVGIDLGTTNSCVAVLDGTEVTVIHNQEGGRTTPSMVSWNAQGDPLVGVAAKRQAVTNPAGTVYGIKRLIGRRYDSPEVEHLRRTLPYRVVAAPSGDAWIEVRDARMSPEEVSALVLAKMKRVAEDYLGEPVTEAVVTVPAYFDDVQRQATKDAGEIAGLVVRAILNEPTAAALAYGVQRERDQRVAVFDLGGGTFDVSILQIESGVFEVLATSGDTFLGGDDFDRALVEALVARFASEHGVDLAADPVALQRLREAAERAKIELSSSLTTEIHLPFLAIHPSRGPLHLQRELKRSELEILCRELLARLEAPCLGALADARLTPEQIDQVVLVGGMSRMPAVQAKVEEIFRKRPSKGVNPDEIVAIGAAVHSGIVSGASEAVLLDVTPHSLGVKVAGGRMSVVVPRNTTVPTREAKVFATTENGQDFVAIEVYQGESPVADENRRLGRFILGDLPARPAGHVRVEVSFTLDANGILEVTAVESTTGKATSVAIHAHGGLGAREVERLKHAHAAMARAAR